METALFNGRNWGSCESTAEKTYGKLENHHMFSTYHYHILSYTNNVQVSMFVDQMVHMVLRCFKRLSSTYQVGQLKTWYNSLMMLDWTNQPDADSRWFYGVNRLIKMWSRNKTTYYSLQALQVELKASTVSFWQGSMFNVGDAGMFQFERDKTCLRTTLHAKVLVVQMVQIDVNALPEVFPWCSHGHRYLDVLRLNLLGSKS